VLEETVAKPLEAALATTENLTRIETEIQEGRVGVNLHFSYGTNVDFALQDASKNLDRARAGLPQEADQPTIFKFDPSQRPVYEVAFSSPTRDLISLRDWVEYRLRPQLLTIEGVASVDISGGLVREVQVVLDQERLRSYGLTVSQVIEAVRAANQDVAAGRVASPEREVVGKTAGKFRNVEDVRAVLLNVPGGGRIPLSEVAAVHDTHREQRIWARLDGVPAVRLSVRKQPNANTVRVADQVDTRLEALRESRFIPGDIQYRTIENQALHPGVGRSVRNAAMAGAILAMFMVFLFLGSLRKTFVIGLAIPIAILATFIMMGLGGLSLNVMTLGALALGVGLLIDNSIVMLENIFRHREEGRGGPGDRRPRGRRRGDQRRDGRHGHEPGRRDPVPPHQRPGGPDLPRADPHHRLRHPGVAHGGPHGGAHAVGPAGQGAIHQRAQSLAAAGGVRRVRPVAARLYRRIAPTVLRWRWGVMAAAVVALLATGQLVRGLGSEFLPQVDDGNVNVMINLPAGASAEETNRITRQLEAMVAEMPDVRTQFAVAGGMFWGGSTGERAGRGSITVVLEPVTRRSLSADAWVQTLQRRINERGFAGARIFVRPPRIRGLRTSASGSAIALHIQGDDLDVSSSGSATTSCTGCAAFQASRTWSRPPMRRARSSPSSWTASAPPTWA
jgi:multidrug efflux pump subunit AcrB